MPEIPNRAYWIAAQAMGGHGGCPVAIGAPGVGKSRIFEAFCRATERKPYVLVPSSRDTTDFYGCPFKGEIEITNGQARKVPVMEIASPAWAAQCWDGQKWAIFLDELTTAVPVVQAAQLRIIADHFVGEMPLPKDTIICAAANPPETAPNGIEFCPPLANRMYHHKWEEHTEDVLLGFMRGGNFPEPKFDVLPDDWEQHLGAVGGMVAAFHKHLPGRLNREPTDPAEQSKPWPSQRTWEYGIRCMAAARSVGAGQIVEHTLLAGLVSVAVAGEYFTWLDNLDLPDPSELLQKFLAANQNGHEPEYEHPGRADKVMAMLASVTNVVVQGTLSPPFKDTAVWEAAMSIMERAAEHDMDVALAGAKPLAQAMPKGARLSAEFVNRLFPRIKTALDL